MEGVMRGKDLELESDFQPHKVTLNSLLYKCGTGCEGVDIISQLPDDIMVHILSFLSLKEAAATSLVSLRWSHLWRYIPNLIFENNHFSDPVINIPITMPDSLHGIGLPECAVRRSLANIEWVNSVLHSRKSLSLKQLTLSLYIHDFQVLRRWLHFALSGRVERLDLDFTITDSILDHNILSSIQTSDYKFLKELRLKDLKVSGEAIELFLRNCSLLEQLITYGVTLTSDLVVGGMLKHLDLCAPESVEISVKVSSTHLTRLTCNYDLQWLFIENAPNLVHAAFFLEPQNTMLQFAKLAANLETLSVTLDKPVVFPVPRMPKLNKFVLDYSFVNKNSLLPVTALLQACPVLQEFTLKNSDLRIYEHDFPVRNIYEIPEVGEFPHSRLRVFEFSGFCGGTADHMELLIYILHNCVALEQVHLALIPPLVACRRQRRDLMHKYPYFFAPSSRDHDVAASEKRDAAVRIKKHTAELLAGKIADHIKLVIV